MGLWILESIYLSKLDDISLVKDLRSVRLSKLESIRQRTIISSAKQETFLEDLLEDLLKDLFKDLL